MRVLLVSLGTEVQEKRVVDYVISCHDGRIDRVLVCDANILPEQQSGVTIIHLDFSTVEAKTEYLDDMSASGYEDIDPVHFHSSGLYDLIEGS